MNFKWCAVLSRVWGSHAVPPWPVWNVGDRPTVTHVLAGGAPCPPVSERLSPIPYERLHTHNFYESISSSLFHQPLLLLLSYYAFFIN